MSWNLFFGSFLGAVAITFVVSMKGAFVAFKASFFQYNCCNKPPHLQVKYHDLNLDNLSRKIECIYL